MTSEIQQKNCRDGCLRTCCVKDSEKVDSIRRAELIVPSGADRKVEFDIELIAYGPDGGRL